MSDHEQYDRAAARHPTGFRIARDASRSDLPTVWLATRSSATAPTTALPVVVCGRCFALVLRSEFDTHMEALHAQS